MIAQTVLITVSLDFLLLSVDAGRYLNYFGVPNKRVGVRIIRGWEMVRDNNNRGAGTG